MVDCNCWKIIVHDKINILIVSTIWRQMVEQETSLLIFKNICRYRGKKISTTWSGNSFDDSYFLQWVCQGI